VTEPPGASVISATTPAPPVSAEVSRNLIVSPSGRVRHGLVYRAHGAELTKPRHQLRAEISDTARYDPNMIMCRGKPLA
jgi:hypothetical protein